MQSLYMVLIGCKPPGRNTEQHDVFFTIATDMRDVVAQVNTFWPEANQSLHIDAFRKVKFVDGFEVEISTEQSIMNEALYFINLGGYKEYEFEEFHYKMLIAGVDIAECIKKAKSSAFYKHTGFKGAPSHIDDKYGIDVDDIVLVSEILPAHIKEKYHIHLTPIKTDEQDEIHLGYFQLSKVAQWNID